MTEGSGPVRPPTNGAATRLGGTERSMHSQAERVSRATSGPTTKAVHSDRGVTAGHRAVLNLHRAIGNAAVQDLLHRPGHVPSPPNAGGDQPGLLQQNESLGGLAILNEL